MPIRLQALMQTARVKLNGKTGERGYILAGVVILMAVFVIMMAVALPKIRESIRRDQETETMSRGRQYIRAVQLYYRKFHRFPQDVDALTETNGLRFLRRRYDDPLTHADDWKPVYFGKNQAPLSMGLFGAVLNAGASLPNNGNPPAGNGVLGTPPSSSFDNFQDPAGGDRAGSGADGGQASGNDAGPAGEGPIMGFSPGLSKDSIMVYKTKSRYDEWEFVYDPAADGFSPRGSAPVYSGPPNIGAPGVGPPPGR